MAVQDHLLMQDGLVQLEMQCHGENDASCQASCACFFGTNEPQCTILNQVFNLSVQPASALT